MFEAHAVLNQRMCAYRDLDLTAFQQVINFLFALRPGVARQKDHGNAKLFHQRRQRPSMLFRQEFGRGHKGDLIATIKRG